MKVTISAFLLLTSSISQAIAVADPVADPRNRISIWCGVAGGDCARMKRSADAIASAFAEASQSKPGYTFCDVQGQPCSNAAEHIQKVGEVNEKAYNEAIVAREARKHKGAISTWCGVSGGDCAKRKREAVAEAGRISIWCGVRGGDCAKKRKREAAPEAGRISIWCGVRGGDCARKREAEAEPNRISIWCGVRGGDCAKRDVEKTVRAAQTVSEWDPQLVTKPCYTEGGECAALLKAHSEFHRIKREAEELKHFDLDAKKAYCATHACDEAGDFALRQAPHEAKRAEEECYAPDGDCTIAARGLDEIESQLNEAIASLAA